MLFPRKLRSKKPRGSIRGDEIACASHVLLSIHQVVTLCSTLVQSAKIRHGSPGYSIRCKFDVVSREAPIDFLLRGKLSSGEEVGLELLPDYAVRTLVLRSSVLVWHVI